MNLLLKCLEERAESPRPDVAVLNLDTQTAEWILSCYALCLALKRKDSTLKTMTWRASEVPVVFYEGDISAYWGSAFKHTDWVKVREGFVPLNSRVIEVESVTLEVWENEEIVFGGLMKGPVYNHFSTGYLPLSVLERAINEKQEEPV